MRKPSPKPSSRRLAGWAIVASLGLGCPRATRPVQLENTVDQAVGPGALAKIEVPKDWRPLPASASRAEFLAPDNHTRAYFRTMATTRELHCEQEARRYAADFIESWGGPPQTKVVAWDHTASTADFELRRRDAGPSGEVIWGRVVCRGRALAIVTCTAPGARESAVSVPCHGLLDSLRVELKPPPPNPAFGTPP